MIVGERVALAVRVFALTVVAAPVVGFNPTPEALRGVLLLAVVIAIAGIAVTLSSRRTLFLICAEACLVSGVIGLSAEADDALLPYLAVPPLLAGLSFGTAAVAGVLTLQVITLAGVLESTTGPLPAEQGRVVLVWIVAGLGIGALGALLRTAEQRSLSVDAGYRTARDLLARLRDLSGIFASGLDSVALADRILRAVDSRGCSAAALYIASHEGEVAALRYSSLEAREQLAGAREVARQSLRAEVATSDGTLTAVPLRTEAGVVAALVVDTSSSALPPLTELGRALAGDLQRLDVALLFDEVRFAATYDERQRLAREVHDGVAQDVASLAYLMEDALASDDDELRPRVRQVHAEITRVVSELRGSVFAMRNGVDAEDTLGSALARMAQLVASRASLAVHLQLDESEDRLPRDVENELLRIGQEAMVNARKHARAARLEVTCRVRPPVAEVTVRDDGVGLSAPQPDSQGIRIMKERAQRIGAELTITSEVAKGTAVSVRYDGAPTSPSRWEGLPSPPAREDAPT